MADIFHIDFKSRTLISKNKVSEEISPISLEKYNYFCDLIEVGLTQVVVNTNIPGVSLPKEMIGDPIKINWSHKFNISDFNYDKYKICGTLSFKKIPFYVQIPWEAILKICHPDDDIFLKVWKEDD